MSPRETNCIKQQILFSGRNKKKKNIINLSSAEFAWRVVKVKLLTVQLLKMLGYFFPKYSNIRVYTDHHSVNIIQNFCLMRFMALSTIMAQMR